MFFTAALTDFGRLIDNARAIQRLQATSNPCWNGACERQTSASTSLRLSVSQDLSFVWNNSSKAGNIVGSAIANRSSEERTTSHSVLFRMVARWTIFRTA